MNHSIQSLALAACLASVAVAQSTWYVDINATPPGAGTQASPFASIQYAISQSTTVAGDTVLVLPGTYDESIDFLGKAIAVQGRDGAAATVLHGVWGYSVVTFANGEGPNSVLRGLTIEGGSGTYSPPTSLDLGGGIYMASSSPTIDACVLRNNEADYGGGMYGVSSSAWVRHCVLQSNMSGLSGDGFLFEASAPTFEDCTIVGHFSSAAVGGHGGSLVGSSAAFVHCTVTQNGSIDYGTGGIRIVSGSTAAFDDCDFLQNGGDGEPGGGAMYVDGSTVTLSSCRFRENMCFDGSKGGAIQCDSGVVTASDCDFIDNFSSYGGAVYCTGTGTFERCVFRGNVSQCDNLIGAGYFGAVYATAATTFRESLFIGNEARGGCIPGLYGQGGAIGGGALLENCTLVGNSASRFGAVHSASLRNCIVWGNTPPEMGSATSASYCDLDDVIPGSGNFSADPQFWGGVGNDLHLRVTSPCIDMGDPASPLDPDGSRADIGAFAFDGSYFPAPSAYCTAKTNSLGCTPAIGYQGTPTLSGADDFVVHADQVRNQKSGILFLGFTPNAAPFHGGTLCVHAPLIRAAPTSSGGSMSGDDCSGVLMRHLTHAYMSLFGFTPGTRIDAQFWYRDPGFPLPDNIGLSDALDVVIQP